MSGAGVITDGEFESIDQEVMELIEDACRKAAEDPSPDAGELTTDVYVKY